MAGDRLEATFALALVGLRSSEILGLARSDVDLGNGTVTIKHQISGSGCRAVLVPTKTASSAATVPLPRFVVERLRKHLANQDAERPVDPIDDALVFVTESGLAINGSWFTKHFHPLLARAGLPTMRLHDLRHGAASLLVDAGAHPRVATELLRHAPGSRVTIERYAHVTAVQQRQAADLLDAALTAPVQSVTQSVTDPEKGVASSRVNKPKMGRPRGEIGSGGREQGAY
jgi:integrase